LNIHANGQERLGTFELGRSKRTTVIIGLIQEIFKEIYAILKKGKEFLGFNFFKYLFIFLKKKALICDRNKNK